MLDRESVDGIIRKLMSIDENVQLLVDELIGGDGAEEEADA